MRCIILFIVIIGVLSGCSSNDTSKEKDTSKTEESTTGATDTSTSEETNTTSNETSQAEKNEAIKEEAVAATYSELNVDNPPVDKLVKVTGEVVGVTGEGGTLDSVLISQEEDGENCLYQVMNMSYLTLAKDDKVTAYGTVQDGKGTVGTPIITATIIERD
ncbi:hypothetical protein DSD26_00055 [Bacillus velezensis]|uniref:hypothetical protein n=1 Tax=Bacillus velezensis TaxID=492670 RepID=UPI000DEB4E2B|nr:hypothetical protein [Bacillus velezensis]RBZ02106.1 hypothetical protein DSD26_00055 [Bacillus velezensis]